MNGCRTIRRISFSLCTCSTCFRRNISEMGMIFSAMYSFECRWRTRITRPNVPVPTEMSNSNTNILCKLVEAYSILRLAGQSSDEVWSYGHEYSCITRQHFVRPRDFDLWPWSDTLSSGNLYTINLNFTWLLFFSYETDGKQFVLLFCQRSLRDTVYLPVCEITVNDIFENIGRF